ncbi:MAG: hypothetical protein ABSB13_10735 [Candidatus Binatus sp.]
MRPALSLARANSSNMEARRAAKVALWVKVLARIGFILSVALLSLPRLALAGNVFVLDCNLQWTPNTKRAGQQFSMAFVFDPDKQCLKEWHHLEAAGYGFVGWPGTEEYNDSEIVLDFKINHVKLTFDRTVGTVTGYSYGHDQLWFIGRCTKARSGPVF